MSNKTKPNIVMMVADDMGYGDFGKFNNGFVITPNLDNIIDEGTCLSQHYSGSAVCSPARAALLTGRYPLRTGVISPAETWGQDRLFIREKTIGDYFKSIGYKTGLIGKWHNGALDKKYHPNNRGFDEFIGFRGGWADYYKWNIEKNGQSYKSNGEYLTNVLGDNAIDFINRNKEEPFFLSVMFNAPHSPLQAPKELINIYTEKGVDLLTAIIYSMIQVMDKQVGRILETLRKLNLENNTIVMFTSDNGATSLDQVDTSFFNSSAMFSDDNEMVKGSLFEGGLRVPSFVTWPRKIKEGSLTNHISSTQDFYATILDLFKIKKPNHITGLSFLPTLLGKKQNKHEYLYWETNSRQGQQAVRMDKWKAIKRNIATGNKEIELFDLTLDSEEKNDVSKSNLDVISQIEIIFKEARTTPTLKNFYIKGLDF